MQQPHYLDELRPVLRRLVLGCLGTCVVLVVLATFGITLPAPFHEKILMTSLSVGWHALLGLTVTRIRHRLEVLGLNVGLYVTLAGLYASALAVLLSLFFLWTRWLPGAFGLRVFLVANNLAFTCAALSVLYAGPTKPQWKALRFGATVAVVGQFGLMTLLALFVVDSWWLVRLHAAFAVLAGGGVAALRIANGPLPPDPLPGEDNPDANMQDSKDSKDSKDSDEGSGSA